MPDGERRPAPRRIAIIGLGFSAAMYLECCKKAGGRRVLFDETWTINALGDCFQCDRVFHMDDVRIQEIRAAAKPDGNIAAMVRWLKKHPGPVYTSRPHADYPGLVAFPLGDVVHRTRFAYFNSTAAYAVAYAVYLDIEDELAGGVGVERLAVFGNDFTYANVHDAEKGRACVEFWLGMAAARGIKVEAPKVSSLLDGCYSQQQRCYGYDTLDVKIIDTGTRLDVQLTPHDRLPTAEEIEGRYDHSRHPSPQRDEVTVDLEL